MNIKNKVKKAEKNKETIAKKEKKKLKLPKINRKLLKTFVCILAILMVSGVSALIYTINKYSRYIPFEEKMNTYGFNNIYDNGSAKTSEKITKLEALKMTISSIYNYSDFDSFYFYPEYAKDEDFLKAMKDIGMIENTEGYDNHVKYVDVLEFFTSAKKIYLKMDITTGDNIEIKNSSKYPLETQNTIKDMVANKIVEAPNNKLPLEDNVVKGMLNEIVVNFVEKYNTITVNGEKLNINPEKLPSNASEYPYTLASVDKEVYEIKNSMVDSRDYANAAVLYKEVKEEYAYIEEIVNKYLDTILNVDYTNLNEDKFKEDLRSVSLFNITNMALDNYLNHVKSNKIQISGTAKIQFPAIYYDGFVYRVRTKLEINIKNAVEPINLVFMDMGQMDDIIYEENNISRIIDIPISKYANNLQFGVYVDSLTPIQHYDPNPISEEEGLTGIW